MSATVQTKGEAEWNDLIMKLRCQLAPRRGLKKGPTGLGQAVAQNKGG